jgi:hypothetical protein
MVARGETVQAYWNMTNVTTCSVTGSNGDHWTGLSSGTSGRTSGVITQQTIYTLSCAALDNSTYTETAIVNLLPIFQER